MKTKFNFLTICLLFAVYIAEAQEPCPDLFAGSVVGTGVNDAWKGWYDVAGCGTCEAFCRWEGSTGSGGNPFIRTVFIASRWVCQNSRGSFVSYQSFSGIRCASRGDLSIDTDGDRLANTYDTDDDNDGILDINDNCPLVVNPGQEDADNDGVGDVCDVCPGFDDNADADQDGLPDYCDDDDDNDGISDLDEIACGSNPLNAASTCEVCDGADNNLDGSIDEGFTDTDGDLMADCIDPDDDNDGDSDVDELACGSDPLDANSTCNQAPIAFCQDITLSADATCQGIGTIDNGSYDPDGDPVTITLSPAGPYAIGTTSVTLTITDGTEIAVCTATVTVTGTDTDGDGICDAGDDDDDNDGILDTDDSDPLDNFVCQDLDGDGCDDCSSGTVDASNDGTDTDGDGLCDAGDTDDDNDGIEDACDSNPLVNNFIFTGIENFPAEWICGNNLNKVLVCHIPSGNPANANTICVSPNAVQAHLNHGCMLGECNPCPQARMGITPNGNNGLAIHNFYDDDLEVFPNPATDKLNIHFHHEAIANAQIIIYDNLGKIVFQRNVDQDESTLVVDLSNNKFHAGIYSVTMISEEGTISKRVVISK